MAEDSKKNVPSVRPKQCKKEKPVNKKITHFPPNNQPDNFENESNEILGPTTNSDKSTDVLSENGNDAITENHSARPISKSPYYVNPHIKKFKNGFAPMMACTLCFELFNAEKSPRIYGDGRTFCLLCLCNIIKDPPHVVKQLHPLNISYVRTIRKFKNYLEIIFSRQSTTYCELERAVFEKNGINNMLKPWGTIYVHRAMLLEDITNYYKKLISGNQDKLTRACKAIQAVENCRKANLSNNCPNLVKNFSNILELIASLGPSFNINSELGAEDDWLNWNSDVGSDSELKSNDKQETTQKYVSKVLETNAFIEVDDKIRYSMVQGLKSGVIFPSFMPKFPSISNIGVAEFVLYDPGTLKNINSVYFEINIASRVIIEDVTATLVCKFNIKLLSPKAYIDLAYLFLGSDRSYYKGAEIEVTNESIIFDSFFQNGSLVPANLPKLPSYTFNATPVEIKEGMVLMMVREQTTKLVIMKYDCVETGVVCYGELEPVSLQALRRISLGRHRIAGCGIEVVFRGKDCEKD